MKSPIANFALSLVLLSTSATFTTAIPAPLPAATGYASTSAEGSEAEAARAQLRPIWRPGPRIDADSAAPTAPAGSKLSVRGPIFRRNAESKFQYRRRASAGLAVAGNIAYGLEERDVAGPFGINQHVPLPVAMRVRREASILEERADDDEDEEDWDCSEYDDDEEDEGDDQEEQWSAPASSVAPAPSSSSETPEEETPSSSSAAAPAPSSSAPTVDDSNNQNSTPINPLLKNKVIGTKKDESNSDAEAQPAGEAPSSSSSAENVTPTISSEAAWIAPAPESTTVSNVFVPEATKKASATKTKSNSKSKAAPPTQPLQPTLTTPTDIAPGTFTVEQGCTRYHTVVPGEVCLGLLDGSKDLNLTLEQLYQYNPAIDSECMNLQIGWGVCIGANPVVASSSSAASLSTPSSNNLKRRRGNQ